jgi:hypothetical protein
MLQIFSDRDKLARFSPETFLPKSNLCDEVIISRLVYYAKVQIFLRDKHASLL